ncbi:YidB family protein, partial [Bradyrhizobium sp. NBAIM08]|uniref:YidB family protein n=1 Tax=Bradyrhizobium sp. NBAIM08 TaxID=2793815 RepID=UPI001CD6445C
ELTRIAQQLGVSEDEAAEAVAQVLPDVVDQATPAGELPDDDELDRTFGRLHELDGAQKG